MEKIEMLNCFGEETQKENIDNNKVRVTNNRGKRKPSDNETAFVRKRCINVERSIKSKIVRNLVYSIAGAALFAFIIIFFPSKIYQSLTVMEAVRIRSVYLKITDRNCIQIQSVIQPQA
ncbi:hypothetical protein EDEG_01508 [Edhazardia aedis USNM 41457]|uniref:Uncharacterized protein n=1 Tax=Edhazardia aedis (strain USNM 41457) TaxID=1003232 RepID=J9D9M0_EDHAE|nr:hypothetical protein EDEG_01508 [Edhazardia aedis USNM 41457]|eukprot:EJW04199.1 hypothetical protein EDEG_01508 [Edhazardia aedis USNM 41457]